jgi:hypothetical protein
LKLETRENVNLITHDKGNAKKGKSIPMKKKAIIKILAVFAKRRNIGKKIASNIRTGSKRKVLSILCVMNLISLKFLIIHGELIMVLEFTLPKLSINTKKAYGK